MTPSKIKLFKYYYENSHELYVRYYIRNDDQGITWFQAKVPQYNTNNEVIKMEAKGFALKKYHGDINLSVVPNKDLIQNFNRSMVEYLHRIITGSAHGFQNFIFSILNMLPIGIQRELIVYFFKAKS